MDFQGDSKQVAEASRLTPYKQCFEDHLASSIMARTLWTIHRDIAAELHESLLHVSGLYERPSKVNVLYWNMSSLGLKKPCTANKM